MGELPVKVTHITRVIFSSHQRAVAVWTGNQIGCVSLVEKRKAPAQRQGIDYFERAR